MLKLEISYRGVLVIVLGLATVWVVIELWPVIFLLVVSLVLMIGLLPYVEAMVRRGIPRAGAVALLFLAIIAVILGLFSLMVPTMLAEFSSVQDNLPDSARELEKLLSHFGIHVELQERARNVDWDELISGRAAVDYGQRILSVTLSLITVLVMTAYLLADTPRLANFINQFIPEERHDEANRLFFQLTRVVGGYLRGQAITSLCIAVYTFALLRIIGVPNPIAFAVLAGVADIVPLVGALVAVIPPVAAALQDSSTQALLVLVGLMAYQQFEDRILVPRVYGRQLNLPPLIVLVAVLAGAELLGIAGVLLALPLAAAARVGIDYIIENRRLPLTGEQPLAPDIEPPVLAADPPQRRRRLRTLAVRRRPRSPTASRGSEAS